MSGDARALAEALLVVAGCLLTLALLRLAKALDGLGVQLAKFGRLLLGADEALLEEERKARSAARTLVSRRQEEARAVAEKNTPGEAPKG